MVKIAVVAASGLSAFAHTRERSALAALGAASGLIALAALFIGVTLG